MVWLSSDVAITPLLMLKRHHKIDVTVRVSGFAKGFPA